MKTYFGGGKFGDFGSSFPFVKLQINEVCIRLSNLFSEYILYPNQIIRIDQKYFAIVFVHNNPNYPEHISFTTFYPKSEIIRQINNHLLIQEDSSANNLEISFNSSLNYTSMLKVWFARTALALLNGVGLITIASIIFYHSIPWALLKYAALFTLLLSVLFLSFKRLALLVIRNKNYLDLFIKRTFLLFKVSIVFIIILFIKDFIFKA